MEKPMKTVVKTLTLTALLGATLSAQALFNNFARAFIPRAQFARTLAPKFARYAAGAAVVGGNTQDKGTFEEQVAQHEKEIRAECAKEMDALKYPATIVVNGNFKILNTCKIDDQHCRDRLNGLRAMNFGVKYGDYGHCTFNNVVNADNTRADTEASVKLTIPNLQKPQTADDIANRTILVALKKFSPEFKKCMKELPHSAANPRCNALFRLINDRVSLSDYNDTSSKIERFDFDVDIK